MTTYEQAIYAIINGSHEHLSIEHIFTRVKEKYPRIVLASVYNNVNKLCEAGLIRRVSIEGMPDRYDRIQRHDHLVCKNCGALMDISFDDLTVPLRAAVGDGFLSYDLKVFYLCPNCAQRAGMGKEKGGEQNG